VDHLNEHDGGSYHDGMIHNECIAHSGRWDIDNKDPLSYYIRFMAE
jgi:hypothetical protein